MSYFSTTINGVGKVVSVDRELVIASLYDDTIIKSLGIEALKYIKDVYIVIDNTDINIDDIIYHTAYICVREDIGEGVQKIRDAIEEANLKEASIERRAKIHPIASDTGIAYSIHLLDGSDSSILQ